MNITKCRECGCTKMAEDRVVDLEHQLAETQAASERWRRSDARNFARVTDLECRLTEAQERTASLEEAQRIRHTALTRAQGKLTRLHEKLLRPNRRLHRYKADIHQLDCGACNLLAILGESE